MAPDEPPASGHPVKEEAKKAMSGGAGAGAVPPQPPPAACYFCSGMPAVVYCRADSAGLCLPCDRHVHGANTVSSRHARAPLCAACRAAAAACRRDARFLCSNCDFEEKHRGDGGGGARGEPLHDRGTVDGYTGCPSVGELAAILGVQQRDKAAGGEGWWSVWEEPHVLSLEDAIVSTTSCHGLQPLLTPSSSPKKRSSPCGELNGEVLRQLEELAKSEVAAAAQVAAYVEAEPAGDQLPPWASSEYAIGHDDFGAFGTEASYEAATMDLPSREHEAWTTDRNGPTDARSTEVAHEQIPAISSAEQSLPSSVEISEVCPSMSHTSSIDNGNQDSPTMAVPTQAQPSKGGGYDIAYPDRGMVISRYKEKRKNRRFGKQIRYESRKARADGRLRIKGRFAKSS